MEDALPAVLVYGPWVWKALVLLGAIAAAVWMRRRGRRALDRVAAPHLAAFEPAVATLDATSPGERVTIIGTLVGEPTVARPEDGRPAAIWTVTEPRALGSWVSDRPAKLRIVGEAGELTIEGPVRVVRGSREARERIDGALKTAVRRVGSTTLAQSLEAHRSVVLTVAPDSRVRVDATLAKEADPSRADYRQGAGRWILRGEESAPARIAVEGATLVSLPSPMRLGTALLAGAALTLGALSLHGAFAGAALDRAASRAQARPMQREPIDDAQRWLLLSVALTPTFGEADRVALRTLWPNLGPASAERVAQSLALASTLDAAAVANTQLRFGRVEEAAASDEVPHVAARAAYALGRFERASDLAFGVGLEGSPRTPEEGFYYAGVHLLAEERDRADAALREESQCLRMALEEPARRPGDSPFDDRIACRLLAAEGKRGATRRSTLVRGLDAFDTRTVARLSRLLVWHADWPQLAEVTPRAAREGAASETLGGAFALLFIESLLDAPEAELSTVPMDPVVASSAAALASTCPLDPAGDPGLELRVLERLRERELLPPFLRGVRAQLEMSAAMLDAWVYPSMALEGIARALEDLALLERDTVGEARLRVLTWKENAVAIQRQLEALHRGRALETTGSCADAASVESLWRRRALPTLGEALCTPQPVREQMRIWLAHGDAAICTECSRREAFCQAALRARVADSLGLDELGSRWGDAARAHRVALRHRDDALPLAVFESRYRVSSYLEDE